MIKPLNDKIVKVLHYYEFEVYVEGGIKDGIIEYRSDADCTISLEIYREKVADGTPFSVVSPMNDSYLLTYVVYRLDTKGMYNPILETHVEDEACEFLHELNKMESWYLYCDDIEEEVSSDSDVVTYDGLIEEYNFVYDEDEEGYIRGNFSVEYYEEDNSYIVYQLDTTKETYIDVLTTRSLKELKEYLEDIEIKNRWKKLRKAK